MTTQMPPVGLRAPTVLTELPQVKETVNDILMPANAEGGATIVIPAAVQLMTGDEVTVYWRGAQGAGCAQVTKRVTRANEGRPLELVIPASAVLANEGLGVTVEYTVLRCSDGGAEQSAPYLLKVASVLQLPAPTIDQAQGDLLNPAHLPPEGATIRISFLAGLYPGDRGEVVWFGRNSDGTAILPFHVTSFGADVTVQAPRSLIDANEGFEISITYVVRRQGEQPRQSPPSYYLVRTQIESGLLVIGARSEHHQFDNESLYQSARRRRLHALDDATLQAVEAYWRYADEVELFAGTEFVDTRPNVPLHVTRGTSQQIISPRNLTGNGVGGNGSFAAQRDNHNVVAWGNAGYGGNTGNVIPGMTDIAEVTANASAYAARRTNGRVVAWGSPGYGGTLPDAIGALDDIVRVVANPNAFAALRANGSVVAWGSPGLGGTVPAPIAGVDDIVAVFPNQYAFAALRENGSVVAWGHGAYGGDVPAPITAYTDIVKVVGNQYAFAALRVTGEVVAWGDPSYGGNVPSPIAGLTDVVELTSNSYAFAALRSNGAVVAWGYPPYGGNVPYLIAILTDIAEVTGNQYAFAARRRNGAVVAWGDVSYGANVPLPIAELTDVVEIVANAQAFVARRKTNQVVAWGQVGNGGTLPAPIAGLTDIVQVVGNAQAFAGLRANGTVVQWGNTAYGGVFPSDTVPIPGQVRAIYPSWGAFAALTSDRRVIVWGARSSGGDYSDVPASLMGAISYTAPLATARKQSPGDALKSRKVATSDSI
ncbi:MAG: RCC1 domain-containing protein [Dyella sp.]|uniref:RCC1 domain-containing protein n=1 Tax=Dyella sp. TaxID=1869338 RepID=UPI003F7E8618